MTIEIGSLVVRGRFGAERAARPDPRADEARLAALREEILAEVREMLEAAERRGREL